MEFQQNSVTAAVSGDTSKISSPFYRRNMTTPDKRNSGSVYCRICHEDAGIEELIDPCECSGTLGLIHTSCLEKWLSTSNTDRCEICKYSFELQKRKKPLSQSFSQWWRTKNVYGPQSVAGDFVCLMVLTPLCVAATYLCAIGASAYTRLGFWEGTGLAVLCCMLVATYCLWLIVTIRFHLKSWQQWRRKNQDVKLIVKHKPDKQESHVKVFWDANQDNNINNNNAMNVNRFTNWIFAPFYKNGHHLCSMQQEATVV